MTEQAERFWMVSGDGPCSMRHRTRDDAEREAKRLARLNPDHWFFVTEAISAHRKQDVESVSLRDRRGGDDGIPF